MTRFVPVLALFLALFAGCDKESLVGPQDTERIVVPADACHPDPKPC